MKKGLMSYHGSLDLADATVATHYEDPEGVFAYWKGHPYKILLDVMMVCVTKIVFHKQMLLLLFINSKHTNANIY